MRRRLPCVRFWGRRVAHREAPGWAAAAGVVAHPRDDGAVVDQGFGMSAASVTTSAAVVDTASLSATAASYSRRSRTGSLQAGSRRRRTMGTSVHGKCSHRAARINQSRRLTHPAVPPTSRGDGRGTSPRVGRTRDRAHPRGGAPRAGRDPEPSGGARVGLGRHPRRGAWDASCRATAPILLLRDGYPLAAAVAAPLTAWMGTPAWVGAGLWFWLAIAGWAAAWLGGRWWGGAGASAATGVAWQAACVAGLQGEGGCDWIAGLALLPLATGSSSVRWTAAPAARWWRRASRSACSWLPEAVRRGRSCSSPCRPLVIRVAGRRVASTLSAAGGTVGVGFLVALPVVAWSWGPGGRAPWRAW